MPPPDFEKLIETVSVRLDEPTKLRLQRVHAAMQAKSFGVVYESWVARLALDRGLRAMEREIEATSGT